MTKIEKIASDTNYFLKNFINKQTRTNLIIPMSYSIFPGGKKIRSKILVDCGRIFNVDYKILIRVGAAIECIHAYSLVHDDLPCMDDDNIRRGKPSTHIKYGEATAVLAGNSLLTLAFEILSDPNFKINEKIKVKLVEKLSKFAGHEGIAGGQFLDLNFEKRKIPKSRIIEMQIKKTGKLFSFCTMVPSIIKNKNTKIVNKLDKIGSDIGLLFQIKDDLIDYSGSTKKVGKKTKKDLKKGKATLISLLGYKNTIKYASKLKLNIFKRLNKFGNETQELKRTINYILERNK